jgi:hypothetical protein
VQLKSRPRMADFARVLAAMDKVLGTDALQHYIGQRVRLPPTSRRATRWARRSWRSSTRRRSGTAVSRNSSRSSRRRRRCRGGHRANVRLAAERGAYACSASGDPDRTAAQVRQDKTIQVASDRPDRPTARNRPWRGRSAPMWCGGSVGRSRPSTPTARTTAREGQLVATSSRIRRMREAGGLGAAPAVRSHPPSPDLPAPVQWPLGVSRP